MEEKIVENGKVDMMANLQASLQSSISNGSITPAVMAEWFNFLREVDHEKSRKEFLKSFSDFQASCPTINKSRVVHTRGGQVAYHYADIDDILFQIKPHLTKFGLSVFWEKIEKTEGHINVVAVVQHRDGYEKKMEMPISIPPASAMTNITQQDGSAITYAKRYSLCALLGINLTSDVDGRGENQIGHVIQKNNISSNNEERPITEEQINLIKSLTNNNDKYLKDVAGFYGKKNINELTLAQGSDAIEKIRSKKNKIPKNVTPDNSPVINNFADEDDPFGGEENKVSDEEFLRTPVGKPGT